MYTDIEMRPQEAIRELKGLKLMVKDKLAWLNTPEAKEQMSAEARAGFAILYWRRAAALKLCIHVMEEAQHLRFNRAA